MFATAINKVPTNDLMVSKKSLAEYSILKCEIIEIFPLKSMYKSRNDAESSDLASKICSLKFLSHLSLRKPSC